jgi:hypothetical protein
MVISSLQRATSFIYKSGDTLRFDQNSTDLWRICPPALDSSHCFPAALPTSACRVLTPDCRCYNWHVLETPEIQERGNCVFVKMSGHMPSPLTITWLMDYTYPILPPGYNLFLDVLKNRLLTHRLDTTDYKTIMTPLVCEKAKAQHQNMPAFDNCQQSLVLNISFIVGNEPKNVVSSSSGPVVGGIVAVLGLFGYLYTFIRR